MNQLLEQRTDDKCCADCNGTGIVVDDDATMSGTLDAPIPCCCSLDGFDCVTWTTRQWADFWAALLPVGAAR